MSRGRSNIVSGFTPRTIMLVRLHVESYPIKITGLFFSAKLRPQEKGSSFVGANPTPNIA